MAPFISREARRPQCAGTENEGAAAKGGDPKQAEHDGKEVHCRSALRGVLTSQMDAIESRMVNLLFPIFTIST